MSYGETETLTLESGWSGSLQYSKNGLGQVWLRGIITAGTTTEKTVIARLPESFRPASQSSMFNIFNTNQPFAIFTGGLITKSNGGISIIPNITDNITTGDVVRVDTIFQT